MEFNVSGGVACYHGGSGKRLPAGVKSLRKDLDLERVPAIIKDMKRAGLAVNGFFMVGCPGETEEDLKETELLIRECKFNNLSITNFQPMPGTPIYDELIKRGEIANDFLPTYFGEIGYVPPTLKDFDLPGFVAKLYSIVYPQTSSVSLIRYALSCGWALPGRMLARPVVSLKALLAIVQFYPRRGVSILLGRVRARHD